MNVPRRRMGRRFASGHTFGYGRWLEGYILLILSQGSSHGYDITHSMERYDIEFTGIGQMGTLYRILRQMEESGLVSSEWDTTGRRAPRRVYSITALGEKYLKSYIDELESLKERIEDFISSYKRIERTSD